MLEDNSEAFDPGIEADEVDLEETGTKAKNRRKKRTSSVPADYDPTPDYDRLPRGYERPQATTWVGSSLARTLSIENLHHLWSVPVEDMAEAKRKHRFLASKIVSVAGEFWVKDKASGLWCSERRPWR